jgi:hypothetical protein
MKTFTAVIVDFEHLARGADADIIDRCLFYCRGKKRILPKSAIQYVNKVTRTPRSLTVHFLDAANREVAQYNFAPLPSFA